MTVSKFPPSPQTSWEVSGLSEGSVRMGNYRPPSSCDGPLLATHWPEWLWELLAAEGLAGIPALQTAHCDSGPGPVPPRKGGSGNGVQGWGRGWKGPRWAGDQSRIASWSPVVDKQLSGQPKQKEGLPGGKLILGTPISPAASEPGPSWLLL